MNLFEQAIFRGDVARTAQLLDEGMDPNGLTHKNEPLLEWVVSDLLHQFDIDPLIEIVRLLASRGARTKVPMYMACFQGQESSVRAMIDYVDNLDLLVEGQTCLHACCKRRNMSLARLLIERGANINAVNRLGQTPLVYSLTGRDRHMARFLIDLGASVEIPDKSEFYPAHMASRHGFLDILVRVTEKHADQVDFVSWHGTTPLIESIVHFQVECAQFLVERSTINHVDQHGNTALLYACRMGMNELLGPLFERGALLEYDHEDGSKSVLSEAVFYNQYRAVEWLVDHGAKMIKKPACFGRVERFLAHGGHIKSLHQKRRLQLLLLVD